MAMERRRYERLPIECNLKVSKLFKQDNIKVELVDADICVTDISKGGIGFTSRSVLPVGSYFDATIGLDEKEYFKCVVKIVRCLEIEVGFFYGAEFVGLAGFLVNKVDKYAERLMREKENNENDEIIENNENA